MMLTMTANTMTARLPMTDMAFALLAPQNTAIGHQITAKEGYKNQGVSHEVR
jgi:hypothetical protein